MVLRDSFTASDRVKIIMLACVCPGITSSDHTLNTLRYAERLKERGPNPQQNYDSRRLDDSHAAFKRANSSIPDIATNNLEVSQSSNRIKSKLSPNPQRVQSQNQTGHG